MFLKIIGVRYWNKAIKKIYYWADSNGIKKITLNVLETNEKAIYLYKKFGFKKEGILEKTKVYQMVDITTPWLWED